MKTYHAKSEIKLKSGEVIKLGDRIDFIRVSDTKGGVHVHVPALNRELKLSMTTFVKRILGKKVPSIRTLEKWSDDGIARSILGKKVEPDGYDSDGFPSWLVALGMI